LKAIVLVFPPSADAMLALVTNVVKFALSARPPIEQVAITTATATKSRILILKAPPFAPDTESRSLAVVWYVAPRLSDVSGIYRFILGCISQLSG